MSHCGTPCRIAAFFAALLCLPWVASALQQTPPPGDLARQAWLPKAPPLPPPDGPVVRVATVEQLFKAVENPAPGATILLADGTYWMPRLLDLKTDGLTLRSESGNRGKVILDAARSRHGEIVWITRCSGVTIADLTIQNTKWNGFKINSNTGVQKLRIRNCVIRNIWQRGIKGVAVPEKDRERLRPKEFRIEHCLFINDRPKRLEDDADDIAQGNYIAGIDVMYATGWTISNNVFVGIKGKTGEGRGAVFLWVDSRDCTIEGNIIIDCDQGICLGNPTRDAKTAAHASRCVVRNNFVTRAREGGLFAAYTKDCRIVFNTVYEPSGRWGRVIRAWGDNKALLVANNLLVGSDKPMTLTDACRSEGNVVLRRGVRFRDPRGGNLHLVGPAEAVAGKVKTLHEASRDIDGRPRKAPATAGAHEVRSTAGPDNIAPKGYVPLFNGRDLAGWKADEEARRHWVVGNGVIDYDGKNRDLWTEKEFGDFTLLLSWRWSGKPEWKNHPVFDAGGNEVKGADGKVKTERMLDGGDSGIFMRGFRKAQANLFCYPCGSGEVWEYRTDPAMPAEVRKAVMPRKRADRPPGEWNDIRVTLQGDRLTVVLNGEEVISNARLPGVPARGPIGLQHEHGTVQFKNIYIREHAP